MATSFKDSAKLNRAAQHIQASSALRKAALPTESVVFEWMALRTAMFAWLEVRGLSYKSTREAIVLAIKNIGSVETATDITFIHHIATLAEWDEDFLVSEQQALMVNVIVERVINKMADTLVREDI